VASLLVGNPDGHGESTRISLSRDERRIFALFQQPEQQVLHVIDPTLGRIIATYDGLPFGWMYTAIERPDGKLLIPLRWRANEPPARGLLLLDPVTGAREESWAPFYSHEADYSYAFDFQNHSPDGRWWLRPDRTALPVLDVNPAFAERLLGRRSERYYGLTLQLWEAFPLRFVRRLTVAWLKTEELPDETSHLSSLPRQLIWDTIAETTARVNADPLGGVTRTDFPPGYSADDNAWKCIEENWFEAARRWTKVHGWQPDNQAFWIVTNGFLSCVGVDGTVSPRLFAERYGLRHDTWLPAVSHPTSVEPLDGRKAVARYVDGYSGGTILFDGAASKAPHRPAKLAKSRDQWTPVDPEERRAIANRIEALKADRKKLFVPLSEWSEAGCTAAINALTAQIGDDFVDRAVDGEVQAVFRIGFDKVDEERFFTTVRDRFPGCAGAIRALIERFVDANPYGFNLYWQNGIGIFGHAVRTLAVLDRNALSTLCRYSSCIDGHEGFFLGETVPALIKAHGFTDEVIDFMVWMLMRFHGELADSGEVWRQWGLGKAVTRRFSPEDFARRVGAQIDEMIDWPDDWDARYGMNGMDKLAEDLPKPHDPWLAAFFTELEPITQAIQAAGLGGPFDLVDHHGNKLSSRDLAGRPYLVTFGHTSSRESCGHTLWEMSQFLHALGPDSDRLGALFITVDPERDTPAAIKDYLAQFDPHLRGLTGDADALNALFKSYRFAAGKLPLRNGDYQVSYPNFIFLTDRDGRYVEAFNPRLPNAVEEMRKYM
jgi:cytochrome oxidase Cu insertion factor (SCO1/SenC/PrrC family)